MIASVIDFRPDPREKTDPAITKVYAILERDEQEEALDQLDLLMEIGRIVAQSRK